MGKNTFVNFTPLLVGRYVEIPLYYKPVVICMCFRRFGLGVCAS